MASRRRSFLATMKRSRRGAGDSVAWKVEPNKRGNIIFVKPVEKDAFSNLNVVTSKRFYSFILRSGFRAPGQQVFKSASAFQTTKRMENSFPLAKERAAYPNTKGFKVANANNDYAYKGSSLSKPIAVFDDGVKTWFRFGPDQRRRQCSRSIATGRRASSFSQRGALPRRRQGEFPVDASERPGGDLRVQSPSQQSA